MNGTVGIADMKNLLVSVVPLLLVVNVVVAQSDVITPGDNLLVEGVPPIPASLAESARRYTEFRSASLMDWHPTRREILIGTRFNDTEQIHQVKVPGGARTQLTFFPERVSDGSYQPVEGTYFVFSKDVGGRERDQLYSYDVATGDTTLLTDGKSKNLFPTWSRGGDRLVYVSNKRNGKDIDLYVINPLDLKTDRMFAQLEGGMNVPLDWSPDDRRILIFQHGAHDENTLWVVDVATGEKTFLPSRVGAEVIKHGTGRFSDDGRGLYVTTDHDSEFLRLAYVDIASKQYKFLTEHIKGDVESLSLSPDGKTLAFITNEAGVGRLRLLDTRTGKEKPKPDLPIGIISKIKWHKNNRDLGFVMTSARYPADVYSLDVQTGKVGRWTFSETGGLNTGNFSEAELVEWKSFDGKMISGFFYQPPAKFTGPRPVIIDIHGGPEYQFRPDFGGRDNYLLNELGVAMIYPNIRGSSGYGKTFLKLDNGFLREDACKDIGALLDWIKTQPGLDADRIMVTGGSYGGFMTLMVAASYGDRIRAALSYIGPSNLVTFLENTESWRQDIRRAEYGAARAGGVRHT